jgi:hypothetical protein
MIAYSNRKTTSVKCFWSFFYEILSPSYESSAVSSYTFRTLLSVHTPAPEHYRWCFFQVDFSSLLILTRMIYYVLVPTLTDYNRLVDSFSMSFTKLIHYPKSFHIYSQLFRSISIHQVKFCIEKTLGQYLLLIQLDRSITN